MMFKDVYAEIAGLGGSDKKELVTALKDTYFLHEQVSKMSVWPLDIGILLKFVATAAIPVVATLISAILMRFLGL